jgi:L-lactate permease
MQVAAENIGVSKTAMLALQSVGGSAGSCVSIKSIIAGKTAVGGAVAHTPEGVFIMRTASSMFIMIVVGTLTALPFFFN